MSLGHVGGFSSAGVARAPSHSPFHRQTSHLDIAIPHSSWSQDARCGRATCGRHDTASRPSTLPSPAFLAECPSPHGIAVSASPRERCDNQRPDPLCETAQMATSEDSSLRNIAVDHAHHQPGDSSAAPPRGQPCARAHRHLVMLRKMAAHTYLTSDCLSSTHRTTPVTGLTAAVRRASKIHSPA